MGSRVTPGLDPWITASERIEGWTRGDEARELAELAYALPAGAQIVEIGSLLGSGAVLLGGARKLAGSGKVHCVDPFDLSGDLFSVPYYVDIHARQGGGSMRGYFDANIAEAGLTDWVQAHPGRAAEVAAGWTTSIDLLFLDGDQAPVGAREAYDAWLPFLKPGGVIAIHNSNPGRTEHHDGMLLIVESEDFQRAFTDIRLIASTTFGVKL